MALVAPAATGSERDQRLGCYVHIPFCARRCDYCDFATWTDRAHLIDRYVDACVEDLRRRVANGQRAATSVFFGGGTPSLLDAGLLVRILDAIPRAAGCEVTVECNPDSVDAAKFDTYVRAGVNRCSFGVQSMRPHVLAALGRTHAPANVQRAVTLARAAGIERINVDLIYGTPGETIDDWRATLDAAIALGTDHVSAYALTVEPATPLGRAVASGARPAPDDDDQADKYVLADRVLGEAGLEWYEVSNWARPGHECRHNQCYWDGTEYVAIGAAGHGFTGGRRWWNARTPERYIERIERGSDAVTGDEVLDAPARAEEAFGLALRTRAGASVAPGAAATVDALAEIGLVVAGPDRVTLTPHGRLLATDVTARLLLAGGAAAPDAVSTRYH